MEMEKIARNLFWRCRERKDNPYMKSIFKITAVILLMAVVTVMPLWAQEKDKKFENFECDLFEVKFQKPVGWQLEVKSEYIKLSNPNDENVQLVFLEFSAIKGTLDEFLKYYQENFLQENQVKVLQSKSMEIAGLKANYFQIETAQKDIGQVIFLRNMKDYNQPYVLALKTPKGQFKKYEPVLLKAIETMKFYKAYIKK